MVSSTTGDGEQPENAEPFWRKIKKKKLPEDTFAHLKYTILGLGDTNYSQFCNGPKTLHDRMKQLGANTFYDPDWADDGVGLELVVEPWIENLWQPLANELGIELIEPKEKTKLDTSKLAKKTDDDISDLEQKLQGLDISKKKSIKDLVKIPSSFTPLSAPETFLKVTELEVKK